MTIFTIGFTQKSARQFFELIKDSNIEILLDIRLNNKSQLAGFTKGDDLKYFLSEICHCKYEHHLEYAPTKDILDSYKEKLISWNEYTSEYLTLIEQRGNYREFSSTYSQYNNICLLCSEHTPENCHRRLLAEKIAEHYPQYKINHI